MGGMQRRAKRQQERQRMAEDKKAIEGLEFDLTQISAGEMADFFDAVRVQNVRAIATTLSKIVVACPWGDPTDPATFLALPFYGAFQGVVDALGEAAQRIRTR